MKDNQAKYPQLRFKGFTDPWEERKLGEISRMYQPLTITGNDLLPDGVPVFGANGFIGFFSEANHIDDQVTISARGEGTGTPSYVHGPVWITGNSMVVNVGDFDIDKYFLFANLTANSLKKYVTGGAQPQLTRDVLVKVPITLPNTDEQKKIGAFFKQLDDTITLHQRKLDLLKEQKKGYLQKMFPKNGAKVPELRFLGFADDWEERKLSEIGKIVTGNTPSTSNKGYYNGDFLFVSPADIQENRYVNKTTTTLTELGFKTGRLVPKGATLFVSIGSTIGKIGQSICDVITNQQINSVISFSDYDDDFIYTSILNSSTKIKQLAATQAVPIINKNEFGKSIIKIPSLEEQQKIGAFFKQLDDTIALHQRKLEKLQELKKGYLQKMFC